MDIRENKKRYRSLTVFVAVLMLSAMTGCGTSSSGEHTDTGVWLWHPGQLSAWQQSQKRNQSWSRCVNVGYPSSFYKTASSTSFRASIRPKRKTTVSWAATGELTALVDGVRQEIDSVMLSPGKHVLEFEVKATKKLPALYLSGVGEKVLQTVEASTDGQTWHPVEYDLQRTDREVNPQSPREIEVVLPLVETLCADKAQVKDGVIELEAGGTIVLDFHELEVGTLCLTAVGQDSLMFTVGESVEEALSMEVKDMEQYPLKSVGVNGKKDIRLPERALRYVGVRSRCGASLRDIRFVAHLWPVEEQLQFRCNDAHLNQLFETGVATLRTSMHEFYLDGVKRDYLPWAMDAVLSQMGADYLFGDRQVTRNCLSIALMPDNPQPSDLEIVDYPLHALIGFWMEYLRYGDISTSLLYQNRILEQLAFYETLQDEDGFIDAKEPQKFIPGWSADTGPIRFGRPSYPQMMLMENFRIAARFCSLWGRTEESQHYLQKAQMLDESIRKHFWDEERKIYMNGYRPDGSMDRRVSYHSQVWAVLTDLYPESDYELLFGEILPNIPMHSGNVSYDRGYETLAYIKAGQTERLRDLLMEVWGQWMDQGNTRFPENFRVYDTRANQLVFYGRPYGLSLCHGANGVPPVLLVLNGILGFQVDENQPHHYLFKPDFLDLEEVQARIPVPEGYLIVTYHKGELKVDAPKGVRVEVLQGNV